MPSYEICGSSTDSRRKLEMKRSGKKTHMRGPCVEGRCIKLVVVVAELAMRICEAEFDLW